MDEGLSSGKSSREDGDGGGGETRRDVVTAAVSPSLVPFVSQAGAGLSSWLI